MRNLTPLAAFAFALAACGEGDSLGGQRANATTPFGEIDFGSVFVGDTSNQTATIVSSGDGILRISDVLIAPASGTFIVEAVNETQVEPGQSAAIVVGFRPRAEGTFEANLEVHTNTVDDPILLIGLRGAAITVPLCVDNNPCTTDAFDAQSGACAFNPRNGDCDDGSACTTNGICVDEACLSEAVTCEDPGPCTVSHCNPSFGCVAATDPDACDDGNPCTADLCDPISGCSNTPVMDATPCAPFEGCDTLSLCVQGSCETMPVPDGLPCSDGDLCSVSDRCQAGECVGIRDEGEPAVVSQLDSFGTGANDAVLLPGGRAVFADRMAELQGVRLTVVEIDGGTMSPVGSTPMPQFNLLATADAIDDTHFVGAPLVNINTPANLQIFELTQAAGEWQVGIVGTLPFVWDRYQTTELGTAVADEYYFVCSDTSVEVFDISVVSAPTLFTSAPIAGSCLDIAVDAAAGVAYVVHDVGLATITIDATGASVSESHVGAEITRISVSGGRAALGLGMNSPPGRRVEMVDLADLNTVRQEIPISTFALLEDIELEGDDLLISTLEYFTTSLGPYTNAAIQLFDVSANAPVASWEPGIYGFQDVVEELEMVEGRVMLASPYTKLSARVLRVRDGSAGVLGWASGPAHGALHTLVVADEQLYSLSPDGARQISAADPAAPDYIAGAVFPTLGSFFSYGLPSAGSNHLVRPQALDASTSALSAGEAQPSNWVDFSAPNAPVVLGTSVSDREYSGMLSNGEHLFGFEYRHSSAEKRFVVYELSGQTPWFDQSLLPAATMTFTAPPDHPHVRGAADLDGGMYAAIMSGQSLWEATLVVVDVSNPLTPSLVATAPISGMPVGLGLGPTGTDVVLVYGNSTGRFSGHTLAHYAVTGGTLTLLGELPLTTAERVLAFDGQTAFIARPGTVTIVDVSVSPPVWVADVPIGRDPLSAVFISEYMYVAGRGGVSVVFPPCPP